MNDTNKASEEAKKARDKQGIMDQIRRARASLERMATPNKAQPKKGCGGCWKK